MFLKVCHFDCAFVLFFQLIDINFHSHGFDHKIFKKM